MKQLIRFFAIMMMVVTMGFATTSCSDDDEPVDVANFVMECTNVTCNGWTDQQCSELKNAFNENFKNLPLQGVPEEVAVVAFEKVITDTQAQYKGGVSDMPEGSTANITFALKNTNSNVIVSEKTLVLTNHNASVK